MNGNLSGATILNAKITYLVLTFSGWAFNPPKTKQSRMAIKSISNTPVLRVSYCFHFSSFTFLFFTFSSFLFFCSVFLGGRGITLTRGAGVTRGFRTSPHNQSKVDVPTRSWSCWCTVLQSVRLGTRARPLAARANNSPPSPNDDAHRPRCPVGRAFGGVRASP